MKSLTEKVVAEKVEKQVSNAGFEITTIRLLRKLAIASLIYFIKCNVYLSFALFVIKSSP